MDKKTNEVLKFLIDWNYLLIEPPVGGSIAEIYFCFIASCQVKGKDKVSWLQFVKCLQKLDEICIHNAFTCLPANALSLTYEDPFKCFSKITHMDRLALNLIYRQLKVSSNSPVEPPKTPPLQLSRLRWAAQREVPRDNEEKLDLLMELVDRPLAKSKRAVSDLYAGLSPLDIEDVYTTTSRSKRLDQLTLLLSVPAGSHILAKERAKLRTPIKPFFDCCDDPRHAQLLIPLTSFDRATNYCKLNLTKLNDRLKLETGSSDTYTELAKCVNQKIHFIPIIQSQTDTKLGDCSYLDTCHKMSSCRYVHYGQLMPQDDSASKKTAQHNKNISKSMQISDFTRGEAISPATRPETPAQWINCDVTKLDFSILGDDFALIIADPSWTIHMNLNYSSLTDSDLLQIRMDKLQKEGLFLLWVTGRTIETGRDFLKKWGYQVVNQITWVKTNQLVRTISTGRTGHWLNHSKEHLLVGLKGNPKWINKCIDPQILISSTRETSRKPDEIYGMVERMVGPGTRKLEIFGRQHNTRPGWLTIGNQLNGTHLVEKEIAEKYYSASATEA
ncbi:hypothetical protein KL930_003028 [Ogataea haglerorum]|uniref:mRNA m(6)A methyltransferase n=1 Tax=Ogataea haglerorum TaxID=1937702 RepID=A0AAN6D643_9ASCO|nr:hypothetical protein KL915_003680 [Ogataea haglerorum]KAG7704729.1 hypothetical protein KL914_004120 [Ogataea haglerorum]KAG7704832.1 hypothetical protein KL950_004005 [Ogataea haglerorum]KAG7719184.1 hypothetical protein KL913_002182 [Ogataea haglerorum]KAG7719993.1 hypothetical protein KL949_001958 [Ogataea haglerorum]